MTLTEAATAIEAVTAFTRGKFKPLAPPTLTPRGACVEFECVSVDPNRVVSWFAVCGYMVTMIAYDGVYSKQPFMVLEWR